MSSEPRHLAEVPYKFMERALQEFAESEYDNADPVRPWSELSVDVRRTLIAGSWSRVQMDDALYEGIDRRARQMADAAYQSAKATHFDARTSRALGK